MEAGIDPAGIVDGRGMSIDHRGADIARCADPHRKARGERGRGEDRRAVAARRGKLGADAESRRDQQPRRVVGVEFAVEIEQTDEQRYALAQ